jgi:hypothetical protein
MEGAKAILEEMKSSTMWLAATIVTTALLAHGDSKTLRLLDVEVSRPDAGMFFLALSALTLIHMVRLTMLLTEAVSAEEPESAVWAFIRQHPWAFNPFSQSRSGAHVALDSLGVVALLSLWWIGLFSALQLLRGSTVTFTSVPFLLVLAYVVSSIALGRRIAILLRVLSSGRILLVKQSLAIFLIFAGSIVSFFGPPFGRISW